MASKPLHTTAQDILAEIEPLGRDSYKRVLLNHGVQEPFFGVKIEELKKIQKRIRKDYQLALDLYATGNYDAMYLAGLIADESRMTKRDLQRWVKTGSPAWSIVSGVAAESPHGWDLALEWIESDTELIAASGWATLGNLVSIKPDEDLDLPALESLLQRVATTIHQQPNRVRYQMNGFVIAAGCFVPAVTKAALGAGQQMGEVTVDMGNTSCQVPDVRTYIEKVRQRRTLGRKRKKARC